jgi:hypothetical protein
MKWSRLEQPPELTSRYRVAMVFQSGALLTSLTVGENVGFYPPHGIAPEQGGETMLNRNHGSSTNSHVHVYRGRKTVKQSPADVLFSIRADTGRVSPYMHKTVQRPTLFNDSK